MIHHIHYTGEYISYDEGYIIDAKSEFCEIKYFRHLQHAGQFKHICDQVFKHSIKCNYNWFRLNERSDVACLLKDPIVLDFNKKLSTLTEEECDSVGMEAYYRIKCINEEYRLLEAKRDRDSRILDFEAETNDLLLEPIKDTPVDVDDLEELSFDDDDSMDDLALDFDDESDDSLLSAGTRKRPKPVKDTPTQDSNNLTLF